MIAFFFSPRIGGNLDVVYRWRRIVSDNMTNRKGRKSKVRFRRNLENSGNNSTLVEIFNLIQSILSTRYCPTIICSDL